MIAFANQARALEDETKIVKIAVHVANGDHNLRSFGGGSCGDRIKEAGRDQQKKSEVHSGEKAVNRLHGHRVSLLLGGPIERDGNATPGAWCFCRMEKC